MSRSPAHAKSSDIRLNSFVHSHFSRQTNIESRAWFNLLRNAALLEGVEWVTALPGRNLISARRPDGEALHIFGMGFPECVNTACDRHPLQHLKRVNT